MLNYNEIVPKKIVDLDGEPFEVLSSHVFRKQQRKPVNQTKLKSLITSKVVERSFHQSEKVSEADVSSREAKYLYSNKGESWFCDPENPKDRFTLPYDSIAQELRFLKENSTVTLRLYSGDPIGLEIPIKVELRVTDAPPAVKGNTAQGATKQVTLETGATISVPIFIGEGDVLRINTDTGEYAERVDKSTG